MRNIAKFFGTIALAAFGIIVLTAVITSALLSLTGCEQPANSPKVKLTGITAEYNAGSVAKLGD